MAEPLVRDSNNVDHGGAEVERQAARAFGQRLQDRARELSKTSTEIARHAGIKRSAMTGYWAGDRIPGSNKLFPIADFLRLNARWLASGEGPKVGGDLLDTANADFVGLPRYDLTLLTEDGKGGRLETVPIRRDWLTRRVGTANGLWITEMPSTYEELGLSEGDAVICSDIPRDQPPPDNTTCFFLGDGLFVARYRNQWTYEANATGPRVGPLDLVDHGTQPIARIRARMLARV